mgnify:CR=1 FL=1
MPIKTRIVFLPDFKIDMLPFSFSTKKFTIYIEKLAPMEFEEVIKNNVIAAKRGYQELEILCFIKHKETRELLNTIIKNTGWKIKLSTETYKVPENPTTDIILIVKAEKVDEHDYVFHTYIVYVETGWRE